MKRIKFALIFTTALMLALPIAGCTRGDSGSATKNATEQQIVTLSEENGEGVGDECPDGKCPEHNGDGKCPDGKCPKRKGGDKCPDGNCPTSNDGDDECPDGNCPARPLLPHGRHKRGRTKPLPRPTEIDR